MPKYDLPVLFPVAPSAGHPVTRRQLFVLAGTTGAVAALPTFGCHSSSAPPPPPYFTTDERSILGALADAIIPPDDAPGGNALGAVDYIEQLLTAFAGDTPLIYAGGPYSGRAPMPSTPGAASPSTTDDFSTFLPLDRVAQRAWMLRTYGSSGVQGGGPNDAITGPVIGLREAVAKAISQAQTAIPANVAPEALTADQRTTLLDVLDDATESTLIELVLEGAFTAPEYGGNTKGAGWAMTYFEGDSQPYGYSTWDATTNANVEHPEAPCSTANPGADPMAMTAATEQLLLTAFSFLGGKVFS